jgi:DNA ligase-1
LLEKTGITYNVFDMLTLTEFHLGISETTYAERRKALETTLNGCISASVRIVPVLQTFSYTEEERALRAVIRLVEEARSEGKEGIMLNICDAKYECKRTKNLLKVKVFQDCDVQIVGFQQGTGKYENTLGALIVDYKGMCVGVGSGLTDEQRNEFWNHQDEYRGRVVTVQYFEETNDAEGNPSMRFPVFKELREEGKEVSYN